MEQSEEKLKRYEAIINSMTKAEREDVTLIKKSRERIERVAKGSGTKAEEIKEFINQFEKMDKFLNMFKKDRGMRRRMEKMMKGGNFNFGA